jgi:hypothetical protein
MRLEGPAGAALPGQIAAELLAKLRFVWTAFLASEKKGRRKKKDKRTKFKVGGKHSLSLNLAPGER